MDPLGKKPCPLIGAFYGLTLIRYIWGYLNMIHGVYRVVGLGVPSRGHSQSPLNERQCSSQGGCLKDINAVSGTCSLA